MNKPPRIAATAVLLALACVAPLAQARDLQEIETPYYTVVSALNESETGALINEMRAFQAVVTAFSTVRDLKPRVPLRIYLLSSADWEKSVRPARNIVGWISPGTLSFVAAIDAQKWSTPSIGEGPSRAGATVEAQSRLTASELLFQGYVHFILRNSDSTAYPGWFEEGLAQLLSTTKISKTKILVGTAPLGRLEDLDRPGGARWLPLKQVLTMRPGADANDDAHQPETLGFEVQSWALLHYLMFEHPEGSKALTQYLSLVRQGVAVEEASTKAFGMTVAALEEKLQVYTHRSSYKNMTADPTKLPMPPAGEPKTRQLNSADSAYELAALLVRLNAKHDGVAEYFDRAQKSQPKDARLPAARANLLVRNGDAAKADEMLRQALAMAPNDQAVLILAGLMNSTQSARGSANDSGRRQAFEYFNTALAAPYSGIGELEVYADYAQLALETDGNLEQPVARIASERQRYPLEPQIAALHAQMLTKLQRTEEARTAWQVAARNGSGALRDAAIRALNVKAGN